MWIKIDSNDYKTFPKEGKLVMTTDGKDVFPAWYTYQHSPFWTSGEYRWINLEDKTEQITLPFEPTHWMEMEDWDILKREMKINQIIE